MFNNDNEKKILIIVAVFTALLFTLASCGKKMTEPMGNAHDIAERIYHRMGMTNEPYESDITASEAYLIGLSEESFAENVTNAKVFYQSELCTQNFLCILEANSEASAEALYSDICKNYDWAPCDPADSAVFMRYGKHVLIAKDQDDKTHSICSAFMAETKNSASVIYSENPM